MASFHFLTHRLVNFPLSKERFKNEMNRIKNIAKNNGYQEKLVEKLVNRHKYKKLLKDITTLQQTSQTSQKFVVIPYNPKYTRGLEKVFNNVGFRVAYKTNNN